MKKSRLGNYTNNSYCPRDFFNTFQYSWKVFCFEFGYLCLFVRLRSISCKYICKIMKYMHVIDFHCNMFLVEKGIRRICRSLKRTCKTQLLVYKLQSLINRHLQRHCPNLYIYIYKDYITIIARNKICIHTKYNHVKTNIQAKFKSYYL